nr:hyp [Cotesia vestalis bracovirus]
MKKNSPNIRVTGATRVEIKLYRDRINYLKSKKHFLQLNLKSSVTKNEIEEIEAEISNHKTAIMQIYRRCGFLPLDIYML